MKTLREVRGIFSTVPQMDSDTEENTEVSEIEVNALKETRLAALEKTVLEQKRYKFAENGTGSL